jgi:hypothetical protein
VATSEVKADILAFSHWMESVGWLESQAQMKPKGPSAPDGFDYDREIEVLATSRFELIGGGVLEVTTEYPETECSHMSTVFLPSENALLTSDLVYHGVHAWAGQGVQREHIANWSKVLTELKGRYAKPGLKVYPGHGAPGDASLFDAMKAYLDELVDTVRTARTNAEALQRMKGRYPSFEQEDFLLAHTIAFHGPDGRP